MHNMLLGIMKKGKIVTDDSQQVKWPMHNWKTTFHLSIRQILSHEISKHEQKDAVSEQLLFNSLLQSWHLKPVAHSLCASRMWKELIFSVAETSGILSKISCCSLWRWLLQILSWQKLWGVWQLWGVLRSSAEKATRVPCRAAHWRPR